MSESMVLEIDCTTGEEVLRPMTEEEVAIRQQMMDAEIARNEAEAQALAEKEAAKASAHSKLAALGLTSEEIEALTK